MHGRRIITLLSDFGLVDSYVAEMKAVILSIYPEARIVDISHGVRKFDIRMGSFLLLRASRFFPKGTVHLAVVDPGVGTERRPIIVETERGLYVGPDNGLLMPSSKMDGIKHIHVISNPKYMLSEISRTFHGRDIFSPAAAYLAKGVPISEFGPEIFDPIIPRFAEAKLHDGLIEGEVIYTDDFGNLVTNIAQSNLTSAGISEGDTLLVKVRDKNLRLKLCEAYGYVSKNELLTIIGSSGFLEISVNQGSASRLLGVEAGEKIIIAKETGF
ncbi:SAM-dependent chlorinase/fluorinase [Candidatus Bathyarchaeota archaeon]|nr:SAM-dependent chlorinase/fluorinase [Candidatus Bathyarchaeota archaeon]